MNDQLLSFNKKLFDLEVAFEQNFPLNKQGIITDDSLQILEAIFVRNKHDLILEQIESNPKAITSAFIGRNILANIVDLPMLEDISDALENADNYFARHISSELAGRKRTVIGMQAPSFNIIDDKNRTFTNDSFKGKYLLLDFWASWCPPCREESPNLLSAYNKYANKGLEIISVSVDGDRSEWEKAIREDGLGWIQVCIGANGKMKKDFGIYFYPSNFLIDPFGKIIAKDLTGADLEKTLDFWFNKK